MANNFRFRRRDDALKFIEACGVFTADCACPDDDVRLLREELMAVGAIIHRHDMEPGRTFWRRWGRWQIRESQAIYRDALRGRERPRGARQGTVGVIDIFDPDRGRLHAINLCYHVGQYLRDNGGTLEKAYKDAGEKFGMMPEAVRKAVERQGGPMVSLV